METEVIFIIYDTFIAANSCKGFFSYFDELIWDSSLKRVYLIKGGPGCGKSTFMKKISKSASQQGLTVENMYCSGDVTSIDGIKIKEKGIVIIDATAPHAYDMKYPGARESIIDMTRFWDEAVLEKELTEIKAHMTYISKSYKNVYGLLKIAGIAHLKRTAITEAATDFDGCTEAVKKLIKQCGIVPISDEGKCENRMLHAFYGGGIQSLDHTLFTLCDTFVCFEDTPEIAYILLSKLSGLLVKMGYSIIKFNSPLCPEYRTEAVLVPQLRLGFICDGHLFKATVDNTLITKNIKTKKFTNADMLKPKKEILTILKKTEQTYIEQACGLLGNIKARHDELEKHYIKAMDYDALNRFTKDFFDKITAYQEYC